MDDPDLDGDEDDLLASFGLHQLIPEPWARWRPLVVDGLGFFLNALPAERQDTILTEQLALPEDAGAEERLVAFLGHCPTLHKLGQVLARHQRLHPDLRRQLQTLESMPPTTPMDQVRARIREELGGDPPVVLAQAPLAEGSVAVVLPFTFDEGGEVKHGVFKVLKPGIEAILAEETAVLSALESFLEERAASLGLPALDYRDTLKTVQGLLAKEICLEVEQANLEAAGDFYRDQPGLWIPRRLPWCTPRLTAMERVFGAKVTDVPLSGLLRQGLADTMAAALIGQPFWSDEEQAVFHADLHAGNLLLADDGRLAVLDWSLTACLSKGHREALVAMVLGGLTLDGRRIRESVAGLGSLSPDDPFLAAAVDRSLDRLVLHRQLPGFDWLLQLLDELAMNGPTGFRGDFALVRKSWLSLAGVMGDLAENLSPDVQLLGLGLQRFLAEVPARFFSSPGNRDFSTHVSNADLLGLLASAGLVSARYWLRFWRYRWVP